MSADAIYKNLCTKSGLAQSESLLAIWQMLCPPDEAALADMLPASADELSQRTGKSLEIIQQLLDSLYHKGAVFKAVKNEKVIYRLPRHIIQFHDASLLWEGATPAFYDLWKKVMDVDFSGFLKGLPQTVVLPPFMRVVPIDVTLKPESAVLPYEDCAELVNKAEKLAVVNCPCRISQKKCDSPIESCIQLNKGAEYALDRGHGRAISRDEALAILRKAEEAGLVHMTENKGFGNAICNCCDCCCEMIRLVKSTGKKWILSPSRYCAEVFPFVCTGCGECMDICPVDAITADGVASIDADICLGCGLCATACPSQAIKLKQIRSEEHIPA